MNKWTTKHPEIGAWALQLTKSALVSLEASRRCCRCAPTTDPGVRCRMMTTDEERKWRTATPLDLLAGWRLPEGMRHRFADDSHC